MTDISGVHPPPPPRPCVCVFIDSETSGKAIMEFQVSTGSWENEFLFKLEVCLEPLGSHCHYRLPLVLSVLKAEGLFALEGCSP